MSSFRTIADTIPGLIEAGLIFKGNTPGGKTVSMAVLIDGDTEVIQDLSNGLVLDDDRLTKPMKSYLTGLAEVGSYLKARHTEDEDGVTEDMIENAALALAFPKVAQNAAAMKTLKAHLDALQNEGVLAKIGGSNGPAARPAAAAKPAAPARPAAPVAKAPAALKPVARPAKPVAAQAVVAKPAVAKAAVTATAAAGAAATLDDDVKKKPAEPTQAQPLASEISTEPKKDAQVEETQSPAAASAAPIRAQVEAEQPRPAADTADLAAAEITPPEAATPTSIIAKMEDAADHADEAVASFSSSNGPNAGETRRGFFRS